MIKMASNDAPACVANAAPGEDANVAHASFTGSKRAPVGLVTKASLRLCGQNVYLCANGRDIVTRACRLGSDFIGIGARGGLRQRPQQR